MLRPCVLGIQAHQLTIRLSRPEWTPPRSRTGRKISNTSLFLYNSLAGREEETRKIVPQLDSIQSQISTSVPGQSRPHEKRAERPLDSDKTPHPERSRQERRASPADHPRPPAKTAGSVFLPPAAFAVPRCAPHQARRFPSLGPPPLASHTRDAGGTARTSANNDVKCKSLIEFYAAYSRQFSPPGPKGVGLPRFCHGSGFHKGTLWHCANPYGFLHLFAYPVSLRRSAPFRSCSLPCGLLDPRLRRNRTLTRWLAPLDHVYALCNVFHLTGSSQTTATPPLTPARLTSVGFQAWLVYKTPGSEPRQAVRFPSHHQHTSRHS